MKKLILLLTISIIFTDCKKSSIPTARTTPPSTTSTNTLAGTWLNTSNATDYFYLTTTSNDHNGNKRYILSHFGQYNYLMSTNSNMVDTVLESTLTTIPGYDKSYYTNSPVGYNESYYLLHNNSQMVITIQHSNSTTTTYNFNQH